MIDMQVSWRLGVLNAEIRRELDKSLAEYQMNGGQARILAFILFQTENNNSVCQKDIEKELNLRASSISSVLDNLEKVGLIERCLDENNARVKLIKLTEKGYLVEAKCKEELNKLNSKLLLNFSNEEKSMFLNLIDKALLNIQ